MSLERVPVFGACGGRAGDGSAVRGQARTVGLLLLTVVTIGLTVSLGAFSFAMAPSGGEDITMASVDVEITGETVTVHHMSGDSLQAEDIRLELNGGERRIGLAAFDTKAGSSERLTAGESWKHHVTFTEDQVSVAVIHVPSETVLVEDRRSF
jgi:hypothetical protein